MTVTEHWWAESPNRDNYARLWSEAEAASYRRAGWDVDGPYVDAADHRGAVDALADAIDAFDHAPPATMPSPRRVNRWRAALAAARGQ